MRVWWVVWPLLMGLVLSCASGSGDQNRDDSGATADNHWVLDSSDSTSDSTPIFSDINGADTKEIWDFSGYEMVELWTPDIPVDPDCPEGSGCFGDPCLVNGDCWSDLCIYHMGNQICSKYCTEECPAGFECKQLGAGGPDEKYGCISNLSHLCLPCHEMSDCSSSVHAASCVVYEGEGTFCGASCDAETNCPEGFECREVLTTQGTTSSQCVNLGGVCECSDTAIRLGLSTPCAVENDAGHCDGVRTCLEEGLGDCDAETPEMESCDGVDNNCNGAIDEATCDDLNFCTEDHCDPEMGCSNLPLSDIPCDDASECTFSDHCDEGTCVGESVLCDDQNVCTDNVCDPATGCTYPANSSACSDGVPCTQGDVCVDKECVPGPLVNCDDNNPCTQDSCDEPSGCLHVANSAPCSDGNACTAGDHCENSMCMPTGATECFDGNPCTTDACDPIEGCLFIDNTEPCSDDDPCTENDTCSGGLCVPGGDTNCNDLNPCTDDWCEAGVGCHHDNNSVECDDQDPCTVTDVCVDGSCEGSGALDCNDSNPCTNDVCVPTQGCQYTPNTESCSDNNVCTLNDFCQGGTCQSGLSTMNCNDTNACTADSCDPVDGCLNAHLTGTECTDSNACTDGDQCNDGQCIPGVLLNCNDTNVCTDDSCNPASGCVNAPNALACDDQNQCTLGDFCSGGSCQSGTGEPNCNDGNICTTDYCHPASGCVHEPLTGPECDDGNACTINDACSAGVCVSVTSRVCKDSTVCTDDSCDPTVGCVYTNNSESCNDNNACTVGDYCQNGACIPGTIDDCNDHNVCTHDSCVPQTGCVHTPNSETCNDNNACTVGDYCQDSACVPGESADCDDLNVCTTDTCVPATGCKYTNNTNPCSDDNVCSSGDVCAAGECVPGATINCNDNNPCTDDSCDPVIGCENVNDDSNGCNDANLCTLGDHCESGECVPDSMKDCDDQNPCTVNSCNKTTGCVSVDEPETTLCNDGNVCTEGDHCSEGSCVWVSALDCSDGNGCTYDNCDPTDGCYWDSVPDYMQCNDSNQCTTGDRCIGGVCGGAGTLSCDDGDPCTVNGCDPESGCDFSVATPTCCGNGILETPQEECDDGCENGIPGVCEEGVDDGDSCNYDCTLPPCPWWDYEQLFCQGSCSYGGFYGCDQSDADILCKLKTCNPNSFATSFAVQQVKTGKGFACANSGQYAGPQPLYGVEEDVWYSTQLYGLNFGEVVTNVTCSQ